MMNNRLEEIKEKHANKMQLSKKGNLVRISMNPKDIEFLIEKAEHAEELYQLVEALETNNEWLNRSMIDSTERMIRNGRALQEIQRQLQLNIDEDELLHNIDVIVRRVAGK